MTDPLSTPCTAFEGSRLLASGPLIEVALALKTATDRGASEPILAFHDRTGRVIDVDLRGAATDVAERLSRSFPAAPAALERPAEARGRGRPKLGVIGREVTLLPRQWEWLAAQPGGASLALRRLVDEARRSGAATRELRAAQERAFHFLSAMAGDFPGFEEAARALFANDRPRFEQQIAGWPEDISAYAMRLAFGEPPDPMRSGKERE